MSNWLLPVQDLTPDQLMAARSPADEPRVVFGPPGSGKTQVLVHRAHHLVERYRVPPERFRIFVFTNVLKDFIRSGIEWLDLPAGSVTTFDSWCKDFLEKHTRGPVPRLDGKPDFEAIRQGVLDTIRDQPDLRGSLDFALVDEGQDLSAEAFEILTRVARHVTVFADHKQQIFEGGASEDQILRTLDLSRRSATFLDAYRNSPDVALLASHFISEAAERQRYPEQSRGLAARERPLCVIVPSQEEELDLLAEQIRVRQLQRQRVGIIVPHVRQVHGFATALSERGVPVEKALPPRGRAGRAGPIRFDDPAPKIATYHSAKGLTFDCVLLPRLTRGAFSHVRGSTRERVLFVGITRATDWVYLSSVAGSEIDEMRLLEEAARADHLVLQRRVPRSAGEAPPGQAPMLVGPGLDENDGPDDFDPL